MTVVVRARYCRTCGKRESLADLAEVVTSGVRDSLLTAVVGEVT